MKYKLSIIKLKIDFTDECIDWEYDEDEVLRIVMQVLKTLFLNRLKQFFSVFLGIICF